MPPLSFISRKPEDGEAVVHGSTTSNGLAVPNDEDGEYTPPLGSMPCH